MANYSLDANHQIQAGSPTPLGVSRQKEVTNFALFSSCDTVFIELYHLESQVPFLRAEMKKTSDRHHLALSHLPATFDYTYQCLDRCLIDPYAYRLSSHQIWGKPQHQVRGRVAPEEPFDWECDARPLTPAEDLIIYEMHVRSFTAHPSSQAKWPGTFTGIIEKIAYLKELGINAVELMPIFEFDECDNSASCSKTGVSLVNYWGYAPVHFFAPMNRYGDPTQSAQKAFKTLVKSLHSAGIEVILDVVYNHTGKSASLLQSRDQTIYYRMSGNHHCNDSGCGNTLNCQHPVVQALIIDSLRHWALEYRVDGFRFDLASILTRDEAGAILEKPPLLEKIARDPILGPTRMIAEPWDPGGVYQVGSFPSWRFVEWNGKYRDAIRAFIRGDGNREEVKKRVLGSPDLYASAAPTRSINYICSHDGFTLHDLVSFNEKQNAANRESNRDGSNDNNSWNCGVEGATQNDSILFLRARQQRNFALALFASLGTPMWLMGDEYGHTRCGNNNAWCQDNTLNYFLWDHKEKNPFFLRFISKLIALRKSLPILRQKTFLAPGGVTWYAPTNSSFLAWTLKDKILIAFNPSPREVVWTLPKLSQLWHRIVDTGHLPPKDLLDLPIPVRDPTYRLAPYSSAFFIQAESK
ncbi:MAG: alpha-amylase family glycosyl hydrolase [Chlamydiota bacterium]